MDFTMMLTPPNRNSAMAPFWSFFSRMWGASISAAAILTALWGNGLIEAYLSLF